MYFISFHFCGNFYVTPDAISATSSVIVAIADFNGKSSKWYAAHKTNFKGSKIETITSEF